MTQERIHAMAAHAQGFLHSAHRNRAEGESQLPVAYDEARHALEVASKALWLAATGTEMGKTHKAHGILAGRGFIPATIEPLTFSKAMQAHTRGAYGYFEPFTGGGSGPRHPHGRADADRSGGVARGDVPPSPRVLKTAGCDPP